MNVFFTCKNTLVIILQFYRLFVVQVEKRKEVLKATKAASGVSSNLAKVVERAAFLGTSTAKFAKSKDRAAQISKENVAQKIPNSRRKHKSQDSVSCIRIESRIQGESPGKSRFKVKHIEIKQNLS